MEETCKHWWLVGAPITETSTIRNAMCKLCGDTRTFDEDEKKLSWRDAAKKGSKKTWSLRGQ